MGRCRAAVQPRLGSLARRRARWGNRVEQLILAHLVEQGGAVDPQHRGRALPAPAVELEGLGQERAAVHEGRSEWQQTCFSFEGATDGDDATAVTVIFDLGVVGKAGSDPEKWTFYVDGIQQVESCPEPEPVEYELIFADEFDSGTMPSPDTWNMETGYGVEDSGWGNNEWQNYTNLPENVRDGQRITGMTSRQKTLPVCPSKYKFTKHDNNDKGVWISELLPHTATVVDDLIEVGIDVLDRWEQVLAGLERDPESVAHQVDWVAKRRLVSGYQERYGLDAGSPKLKAIDLQYHDIHPDRSLHRRLVERGAMRRMFTDEEIAQALLETGCAPPGMTEAYLTRQLGAQRRSLWSGHPRSLGDVWHDWPRKPAKPALAETMWPRLRTRIRRKRSRSGLLAIPVVRVLLHADELARRIVARGGRNVDLNQPTADRRIA